jgi:hypothetical protein
MVCAEQMETRNMQMGECSQTQTAMLLGCAMGGLLLLLLPIAALQQLQMLLMCLLRL